MGLTRFPRIKAYNAIIIEIVLDKLVFLRVLKQTLLRHELVLMPAPSAGSCKF